MFRPAFAIFAQQYLKAVLNEYGNVYLNEPIPREPKLRIYKHPSRTNWGTEYLTGLTASNAQVMVSPEVVGEAELVDVLFEPKVEKSRTSLGLLGELVDSPSIIEVLRHAPTKWDLQTCLRHWLTWNVEADGNIIPVDENSVNTDEQENSQLKHVDKTLLIITPSIAPQHLKGFAAQTSVINIPGVYSLAPAFCTTIVVTSELPQDASTLWLRLLGKGPTQRAAIMELMELDVDYPHRAVVIEQLRQWYQLLSQGQMGKESFRLMLSLAIVDEFP